uniref:Phosphorylase b kinase regulatory subunit n=1 Tax=Plectus sambesii TaxID=2011161 RepID=A0A914USQ7_9BILA
MRSRSGSGVRLDRLYVYVASTILKDQDPVTGLIANNAADFPAHAWVRDNVYAAHALWGLYRAYRKSADFDEDVAKANELGLTCVKIMQSLLDCMMRQAPKVEMFKRFQRPFQCLHAKYSTLTKGCVVGDREWGHLQVDATSLFLLTLAQMTASGLQIVRNFDDVAFIQNLVYYIETGYRTPDFGIWERGDKTNQGIRELNASSIGMVKAALQALNDVGDLFGDGSKGSVIHVLPDEIQQCSAVLASMLPRESFSKETDAALLCIISYPAFAVEDAELVDLTRETIVSSLLGRYGCRRFIRDGYKTAIEDPNRLYYNNAELQQFEDIECEWPLFLCYLMLDALFCKNRELADDYWHRLEDVLLLRGGYRQVPELYIVPSQSVAAEKLSRGSQDRVPSGTSPHLWAQSMYILCSLVYEGFLSPAELDPLSRRLAVYEKRPPCEVQVVILAETFEVQQILRERDVRVQTIDEVDSVFSIQPASVFARILQRLGESEKMNLSGRPADRDVGLLSTSKFYQLGKRFIVFTPQFMDHRRSHLMHDIRILMDEWRSELQYIYSCWNSASISGRPLVVLVITKNMLDENSVFGPGAVNPLMKLTVVASIKKISSGYLGGARVVMKNINEFFRTTAVSKLEFHDSHIDDLLADEEPEYRALPSVSGANPHLRRLDSMSEKDRRSKQFSAIHKASMRHRSIFIDSNDADLAKLRLAYANRTHSPAAHSPSPRTPAQRSVSPPDLSPAPLHAKSSPWSVPNSIAVYDADGVELSGPTNVLHSVGSLSSSMNDRATVSPSQSNARIDVAALDGMSIKDVVDMLNDTDDLEEQASLVHYLWMKRGPDFDTQLNSATGITVRLLMEELYSKACTQRMWGLVRLTSGILTKRLDDLPKAVTHLLVRQKQLTVGIPSKSEEPITCPKTNEELKDIMHRAYGEDPNSFTLAQEIIISLGSLVRTEPKLFVEMFRLRIGLIIQVLASELARIRQLTANEAAEQLLAISPFELKSMLFSLLSGRLLEEVTEESGVKEQRTGMGSIRKQIETTKSMRKSMRPMTSIQCDIQPDADALLEGVSESEGDDFSFGIWLRHRRIDGALNRVPPDFYASVWDTVRRFPRGLSINGIVLHWGFTQEMTRRETKFALQVEEVLNRIPEPEYREIIVEALSLMAKLDALLKNERPRISNDQPCDVDSIVRKANQIFIDHNREMDTIVVDCCGSGDASKKCDGARGICKHFYDSAPAGEYGTAHYTIRAIIDIFGSKP